MTAVSPRNGPTSGENKITISGLRFRGVKAVDIGSRKASRIRVISSSKLQVDVPKVAGFRTSSS